MQGTSCLSTLARSISRTCPTNNFSNHVQPHCQSIAPTHPLPPSLSHSFTHSFIHSLTHSLTIHSTAHFLTHSLTIFSLYHSFTHSITHSFTRPSLHALIDASIIQTCVFRPAYIQKKALSVTGSKMLPSMCHQKCLCFGV